MYKVLNISEEGRGGGAIGRMRIIANELKDQIETIIVVPRGSKKYIKTLEDLDLNYREISLHPMTKDPWGALLYLFFFIPELFSLIKLIKKERPDIVHCNGSWQIKGVISSKLARVPAYWHMNDTYQPRFVELLFEVLSNLPKGYIYASERTKAYYQSLSHGIQSKESSIVLQAPVDRNIITPTVRKRRVPINLLMIGYINVHKGIELLIKAASMLKDVQVQIDIVGPVLESQRNYKASLEKQIKKLGVTNVSFLGFQAVNESLLSKYHYYICSSIREASPMAVWESLASGLPIVSTDVGDVKSIIEQNNCGIISKEMNGASLARSIRTIINQADDEYEAMSENAVIASDSFDKINVAKRYFSFYKEVINKDVD